MFLLGLLLCIFAVLGIEQYSNKVSKERHEKEVLQAKQDSIWLAEEREEQSAKEKNSQLIQIINIQNETIKSKDAEIKLLRKILADNGIEV